MYLRRAISHRNTILLLRNGTSALQSDRNLSHFLCSRNSGVFGTHCNDATISSLEFLRDSRRGFAKAKKSSTYLISLFTFFVVYGIFILRFGCG